MKVPVSLRRVSHATSCVTGGIKHGTAISGVGRVEEETCRVRQMVEATTAEARSVRGDIQSRVATLAAAAADASAARTVEEISSRVKEAIKYSDAQASRVIADVTQ